MGYISSKHENVQLGIIMWLILYKFRILIIDIDIDFDVLM